MVMSKREVSDHVLGVLKALLGSFAVPDCSKIFRVLVAIQEVTIQKLFAEVEKFSFIQR